MLMETEKLTFLILLILRLISRVRRLLSEVRELFPLIYQGRDSTIEPAYLAEKKEVIPESNLIELDVTPTSEA